MDVTGADGPRATSQGSTPICSKDTTGPGASVVHMAGQQTCPQQRDKTMGEDPPAHDRSLIQVTQITERAAVISGLNSKPRRMSGEKDRYIYRCAKGRMDEVRWTSSGDKTSAVDSRAVGYHVTYAQGSRCPPETVGESRGGIGHDVTTLGDGL